MNRSILFYIPILILITLGCEKDQKIEAELSYKNTGSLQVSVKDDEGSAIEGVSVVIGNFDAERTNSKGVVKYNDITEGYYTIYLDKVMIKGIYYNAFKLVYIDGGVDSKEEILPTSYIGDIETIVRFKNNSSEYVAASGKTIYLVKEDDVKHISLSMDNIDKYAIKTSVTGTNGIADFQNIPSGFSYKCCYENSYGYLSYSQLFSFLKADITAVNILIN